MRRDKDSVFESKISETATKYFPGSIMNQNNAQTALCPLRMVFSSKNMFSTLGQRSRISGVV